eukprot:6201074-Pleurochrysis_carterae.AAC.1
MSPMRALLYCSTQTRPDIAFAVGMLCRAMSCPTAQLLTDARRVLKSLYHHRSVGLRYATINRDEMHGFLLRLRLGSSTLHFGICLPVRPSGDIVGVEQKAAHGGTLLVRGRDHRGVRGHLGGLLPPHTLFGARS